MPLPAPAPAPVDVIASLVHHLGSPVVLSSHRRHAPRYLVVLTLAELNEFGHPRERELLTQLADRLLEHVADHLDDVEGVWIDAQQHRVVALLGARRSTGLRSRVNQMYAELSSTAWLLDDGSVHWVDIGAGYSPIRHGATERDLTTALRRVTRAAHQSLDRRDLVCVKAVDSRSTSRRTLPEKIRLPLQVLLVLMVSTVGPFLVMRATYAVGVDTSSVFYVGVVIALAITSVLIWTEALHALTPMPLPARPTSPPPKATAIIAAYLPNEADTIIDTVTHVLGQDYPGDLQVILAYNTPVDLPVEDDLRTLAHQHPELELLRVDGSTSKAQNVNAALQIARGEFVGVFDADHQPMPGSFTRAWHWIADGADVVQGHCVVRNGDESWVARAVAVEFEQIYAVSHPGRASMHGFGIFGGSNGFWRTSVLRRFRMRVDRLTEDIDVSIRSILGGGTTIVSDPGLISRELAPVTVSALWRQRMRWAQGWFQVSVRQLPWVLSSRSITTRQRFGMVVLFLWRETYPWISPMIIGVLGFLWWRDGSLSWSSPLFLLTTLYTLAAGPVQILFAWRLAAPEMRRRPRWFIWYLLVIGPFYNEWKNLVGRVAQVKELSGEHEWRVTPRGAIPTHRPQVSAVVATEGVSA